MIKTIYVSKLKYLLVVGVSLILSFCLLNSPLPTVLFLLAFIVGTVLHKKIKVLLVLTILYILFFCTLTSILWTEYLGSVDMMYLDVIIYNPLLTCILTGFLMYVVLNTKILLFILRTKLKKFRMIKFISIELLILIVFLLLNYLFIKISGGHPVIAVYVNTFFLPITMFVAVKIAVIKKDLRKSDFITILKITLFLSLLLACFGVYEFAVKENFLFEHLQTKDPSIRLSEIYLSMSDSTPYRIFTFMGHPLKSAFLFMVAALYSLIMKRTRFFLLTVFTIANILTFSRATIILIPPLLLLFLVLRSEAGIGRRMLFISAVLLIGVSIYISPLRQNIVGRFESSEGSTAVRVRALKYVKNTLPGNIPNLLLGKGAGSSWEISERFIMSGSSFEIPWIMMAIDNGIIVTSIYMFILLHILIVLFKNIKRNDVLSIVSFLVLLGGLIQLSSTSAIVNPAQMSLFLWYIISLAIGYRLVNMDI